VARHVRLSCQWLHQGAQGVVHVGYATLEEAQQAAATFDSRWIGGPVAVANSPMLAESEPPLRAHTPPRTVLLRSHSAPSPTRGHPPQPQYVPRQAQPPPPSQPTQLEAQYLQQVLMQQQLAQQQAQAQHVQPAPAAANSALRTAALWGSPAPSAAPTPPPGMGIGMGREPHSSSSSTGGGGGTQQQQQLSSSFVAWATQQLRGEEEQELPTPNYPPGLGPQPPARPPRHPAWDPIWRR
jgi:hypothetical protein